MSFWSARKLIQITGSNSTVNCIFSNSLIAHFHAYYCWTKKQYISLPNFLPARPGKGLVVLKVHVGTKGGYDDSLSLSRIVEGVSRELRSGASPTLLTHASFFLVRRKRGA